MKKQFIKQFSEISKKDLTLVGGKGANLGEMSKINLPVPPGFVVTARAYDEFLRFNRLAPKIQEILLGLTPDDTAKIAAASRKIKELFLVAQLPPKLRKEIEESYEKLGKDIFVAVRSSATAEDLPTASFAGQQATFLNIKGKKQVLKAVQKCFASLFEPRAIYYRMKNHFDHLKVKLAVPVQAMVQSEVSGIMFSLDPVTSDKTKVVIEAGYGLGEAVVSGLVTPDRYVVDKKEMKIVGKEINKQEWMIAQQGNKNVHKSIPKSLQESQKLTDEQILSLAHYNEKLEKHYGIPMDTEWALEKGKIYFVQTRPITTVKQKTETKEEGGNVQGEILVQGLGASIGAVSGPVKLIHKPSENLEKGEILVTEFTNPSFVPLMQKAAAIVTDTGGATSHAAIISRELGIPCVVGTKDATHKLKNGQLVTVDGEKGVVYKGAIAVADKKVQIVQEEKNVPQAKESIPITGTKVYVNLAEPQIAPSVAKEPVDGVGLLRAEFMIAQIGEHPKTMVKKGKGKDFAKELSEGIKKIAAAFYPRPVVYRATDFKTNEYAELPGGKEFEPQEENPMLGFRGAFRYIKEPEVFKLELWALRRVREQFGLNNVWLMIPFVRTVSELRQVKEILESEGMVRTHDFKLWMMAEVPSNVFLIEQFCQEEIDGISIGSNDLTQLILGVDRDSEIMAEEFNERNEAVILAIKKLIAACRRFHITCSLCGQAASEYPEFVEVLIREGITSVSVNPDRIIETKKLIASIEKRIMLDRIKEIEGLLSEEEKQEKNFL